MSHPNFEDCRLTTMTLVITLIGSVNLEEAFALLPITHLDIDPPKRQKKKFELPNCQIPGAILSMRYREDTRGIVRSTNSKYFKNSITIDLSTKIKNVSIKLSKTKIQMCGASSEEVGRLGAQHLIDHLLQIQDEIDYINANKEVAKKTVEWLANCTKGKPIDRPVYREEKTTIIGDDGMEYEQTRQVFSHNEKEFKPVVPEKIDQAPDARIAQFLIKKIAEFEYHSYFCNEIEWIINIEKVASKDLAINKINKAMVNYNYNVGFKVDRYKLCELMRGRNGFFASYDNCVEHCVKIKLPYQPKDDEDKVRKKSKVPCHCFLVYRSGVVTQTGPGDEEMKRAYEKFWDNIAEIKDSIKIEEEPAPEPRKIVIIRRR